MNRRKVKLRNTFHRTECLVWVKKDNELSYSQVRNAWQKLCGLPHCSCGDVAGCRPAQVDRIYRGVNKEGNRYKIK